MDKKYLSKTEEYWNPVIGYENTYAVSSWGRVKRLKGYNRPDNRLVKGCISNRTGHLTVTLCELNIRKNMLVHRLVAMAFIGGPPSPEHEVAHNDDNPEHNHVSNLRWTTSQGNASDRIRHKKTAPGTKNGNNVLQEHKVLEIRKLAEVMSLREVADIFGICKKTVHNIKTRKQWAWLKD